MENSKILKTIDGIIRTDAVIYWWMTTYSSVSAIYVLQLSETNVNSTNSEAIMESVDMSNEPEKVVLHLFNNELSAVVPYDYLGHFPD